MLECPLKLEDSAQYQIRIVMKRENVCTPEVSLAPSLMDISKPILENVVICHQVCPYFLQSISYVYHILLLTHATSCCKGGSHLAI